MRAGLSIGGALHGTERKRGTQQIATEAFESLSVATVDGDGGMKLHAEGREKHRFHRTGLGAHGRRAKPG